MEHTQAYGDPASRPAPRVTVGALLLGIAGVHELVGVAAGLGAIAPDPTMEARAPLAEIARAGVFAAVEPDPVRMSLVWFLLFGCVLALLGLVAHEQERAGTPPSRAFAAGLAALCVLGVVLMPASGFWLGLAAAALAWRRARRKS